MTAATYTFTLSAAQSSSVTMNVAMRAKTGSSIPGSASRWQGDVMPTATLTWAAGVTTATTTVNTAPNSAVDGNAEYEWYKVSSSPSDLTFSTASLPTVTITDDDTGGGGNVVYGPTSSADTGYVNLTSTGGKLETFLNNTNPVIDLICSSTGQPGYRLKSLENGYFSGYVVASDGSEGLDSGWNFLNTGVQFSNTPATVTQSADGTTVSLTVGSYSKTRTGLTAGGTYIRHRTNGAAVTSTITKN